MQPMQNRRQAKAFTLVELLVVIGIIAVLISILLPSLARARQQANMVSCLSNVRQLGQGLLLYTNDNKGFLPYGEGPERANTFNTLWVHEVSAILGKDPGTDGTALIPALRCPEAFVTAGTYNQDFRFHYSVNPRLMPSLGTQKAVLPGNPLITGAYTWDSPAELGTTTYPSRRQLATVTDGASKMLLWDGAQVTDAAGNFNNNANIRTTCLDNNAFNNANTRLIDPPANDNLSRTIWISNVSADNKANNVDSPTPGAIAMRFRHNNNTQMCVLFCDGHAEQRGINQVTLGDVSVNFK